MKGATHKWYNRDGSFRGWLMVADGWVSFSNLPCGWVVVAKDIADLNGMVEKL